MKRIGELYLDLVLNSQSVEKIDTKLDKLSDIEKISILVIKRESEIRMTELAGKLKKPNSTINYMVKGLIKKELVEKKINEIDKRVITVKLTEKGENLGEEIINNVSVRIEGVVNSIKDQAKAKLTFDEYINFEKALKKLSD